MAQRSHSHSRNEKLRARDENIEGEVFVHKKVRKRSSSEIFYRLERIKLLDNAAWVCESRMNIIKVYDCVCAADMNFFDFLFSSERK